MKLVDTSLQPVLDVDGEVVDIMDELPVREIYEFPKEGPVRMPHTSYINNLYLYPFTLNFSKANLKSVLIKLEIRDNDDPETEGLKVCLTHSHIALLIGCVVTYEPYSLSLSLCLSACVCVPPPLLVAVRSQLSNRICF
jgi:hypothetical protein